MATTADTRGLNSAGRRLWESVTEAYDLRADEKAVLRQACFTVDTIEALRKKHESLGNPLLETGSTGQTVTHPLVLELRAQRAQLPRLLSSIGIRDTEDGSEAAGAASSAGRSLVSARWSKGS